MSIGAKVEEAGDLMVPSPEEQLVVFRRLVDCQRYCDIQLEASPFSGGRPSVNLWFSVYIQTPSFCQR